MNITGKHLLSSLLYASLFNINNALWLILRGMGGGDRLLKSKRHVANDRSRNDNLDFLENLYSCISYQSIMTSLWLHSEGATRVISGNTYRASLVFGHWLDIAAGQPNIARLKIRPITMAGQYPSNVAKVIHFLLTCYNSVQNTPKKKIFYYK